MAKKIRAWRLHKHGNQVLLFIIAFGAIGGVALLLLTHAASPYTNMESESGAPSSLATQLSDNNASGGKAIQFGSSSGNPLTPMQLLNRRSDVKVFPSTGSTGSDSNYSTTWNPGSTGTLSYDLSAVPAANRNKIILAWYTGLDDGYSGTMFMNGECPSSQRPIAANYTIDVNAAAGGSSAPTSGWVNAASITNNIYFSRQHLVNMINPSTGTPYNWIRLNITSSVSGLDLNVDVADASKGVTDDWIFLGDSITTLFAGHSTISGSGTTIGPSIDDLVATAMGSSYNLISQNGGSACTLSTNWTQVYSPFSPNATIDDQLAMFPGKYVTLNLGTNDAWNGGGDPNAYAATMQTLANKIIAAGKTPVIPDIPWPNNGDGTTWDNGVKAYNAKIDQLVAANPNIIKGPDMYKVLQDHTSWFQGAGNVHPNEQGSLAYRCAWTYAIAENVYKTTPTAISSCNGLVSP